MSEPAATPLARFLPAHLVASLARAGEEQLPPFVERLDAALLFSDISGFTALTERLQRRGRAGAEEVVRIVNAAFAPAIATIDALGGSIVTFGGDALFSLFEGEGRVGRACAAAEAIREQFQARGAIPTSVGPVTLGISQVVHDGAVSALHLGSAGHRVHVVAGRPVATLARLEATAVAGEIAVSRAALARRRAEPATAERPAPPPPVPAQRLLPYVAPHVKAARLPFEGEFRRVVIMFLETRGLALPALQAFLLRLQDVLARYDGILVSPDLCASGIRWLCAFGAPASHEDDPDRAARAALELLAAVPRGIQLRGGIHAGTAAHIQVGSALRASLELMGDVTNTAARVLAQSAWGEVLVAEETRRLLAGVEVEARGARSVKGKAASLELHALRAAAAPARPLQVLAPMVGRDAELARICAALDEAAAGSGSAFAIKGEAGVGKSRLKYEASRRARELGFDVWEGRAIGFGGMPYWAIAGLLRKALSLPELPAPGEVVAQVAKAAARLGLTATDAVHLENVLGVRRQGSPLAELDPKAARHNDMSAIRALVLAMATERPQLLVLEDMHWSDGASGEAADWLASAASFAGTRSVLLLLHRPGYAAPAATVELALHELGKDHVDRLLESYLGAAPGRIAELVHARAGGNPFYVEEVVRHLREAGLLLPSADGFRLERDLVAEDLPPSVEAVIAARLDRLDPEVRAVAQQASVIGRSFLYPILAALPDAGEAAGRAVAELCRRQLTFELRATPHLEYIFKHALTRDVAYASILERSRRRVHAAVADAIESALSGERDVLLAMIAHHRERAGQLEEARACYLAGARRAVQHYAHEEAEALFRGYLALVAAPTVESVDARSELASRVLEHVGRMEEAEREHRRALAEAVAIGDPRSEGEALLGLEFLLRFGARMDEARPLLERAMVLRGVVADESFSGDVLAALATFHNDLGEQERAEALLREALAHKRRAGDRRQEGRLLHRLAGILYERGRMEEARRTYRESIAIHREVGNRASEALALGNMAGVTKDTGDTDGAVQLLLQALAIHRELGDRRFEAGVLGNLGGCYRELGRLDEAEPLLRQAMALHREVGNRRLEGAVLGNLADLHKARGLLEIAEEMFTRAIAIHREVGNRRSESIALTNLAGMREEQGRVEEARELHEQSLALQRALGDRRFEGVVLCHLGANRIDAGRIVEATGILEQALVLHREVGDPRFEGISLCHLGNAHLLAGRMEASRAALDAALARLREVNAGNLEGAALDLLAVWHLVAGEAPRALELVLAAEPLVAAFGDHTEALAVICVRGHVELALGRDASPWVRRAAELVQRSGLPPASPSRRTASKLARAQAAFELGEILVGGHAPEDLTAEQRAASKGPRSAGLS